jgi:beta-lactamase class A
MEYELSRGAWLFGVGATLVTGCVVGAGSPPPPARAAGNECDALAAVEGSVGGRVGVFALDTGTGRHLGRREDERFAMCSTFKWALAAAILARVDRGELSLDERVPYRESALLEYAPVTSRTVLRWTGSGWRSLP